MRRVEHAGGVVTWHFEVEQAPGGVVAALSTRHGGVSGGPYAHLNVAYHVGDDPAAVAGNRDRLCRALGVGPLTVADQQHGCRVAVVDEGLAGAGHPSDEDAAHHLPATDGLVTDQPGIALSMMVADCAPVVLLDAAHHAIGVAHCGRQGAVLDVVGAVVSTMADRYGTDPAQLWAGVGPCVAPADYEIGGRALDAAAAALGTAFLAPTRPGHATFDLLAAVVHRLAQAGVPRDRVELSGMTTSGHDDWYSDRKARPCGRFMLVAALV